jgi:hypothetical protein
MKKLGMIVAGALCVSSIHAGEFIIGSGLTISMGSDGITITAPPADEIEDADVLTRKKNNNAAMVLQGLAQSCAHLGTVVAANNQKEKQQGILNILGTILGTAAQLSAHNQGTDQQQPVTVQIVQPVTTPQPIQQQEQQSQTNQLTTKVIDITVALLDEVERDDAQCLRALPTMLSLVKTMRTYEEKERLISALLTSPEATRQFMDELFTAIIGYVHEALPVVMEDIKEDFVKALAQ